MRIYRTWPRTAFLTTLAILLGLQAVAVLPWDLSELHEAIVWAVVTWVSFEMGATVVTLVSRRVRDRSRLSWGPIADD